MFSVQGYKWYDDDNDDYINVIDFILFIIVDFDYLDYLDDGGDAYDVGFDVFHHPTFHTTYNICKFLKISKTFFFFFF